MIKKSHYRLLLIFLVPVVILNVDLFLKSPHVWPDESMLADIALNFLKEGRMGSDLAGNAIPGFREHMYWYPPLYILLLSSWFKLFGVSIIVQRILSIIISIFSIVIFYQITKIFLKNKNLNLSSLEVGLFSILSAVGLIADVNFSTQSRMGRPEILVFFFGTLSMLSFLKFINSQERRDKLIFAIGIGFFSALAFLTHFLALFFFVSFILCLLMIGKLEILKSKYFYIIISSFGILVVIWFLSIYPNLNLFLQQMGIIKNARVQSIFEWVWSISTNLWASLRFAIYLISSIAFAIFTLYKREKNNVLFSIYLLFSFFSFVYGRGWYGVFWSPFAFLSIMLLSLYFCKKLNFMKIRQVALFPVLFILLNLFDQVDLVSKMGGERYSYFDFTTQVTKAVPQGKNVFLATIPDSYYAFVPNYEGIKIYQFAAFNAIFADDKFVKEVLDDSDYVIYSGSLSTERFLEKYIRNNLENVNKIGGPNQYEALVIKLKPKLQRI